MNHFLVKKIDPPGSDRLSFPWWVELEIDLQLWRRYLYSLVSRWDLSRKYWYSRARKAIGRNHFVHNFQAPLRDMWLGVGKTNCCSERDKSNKIWEGAHQAKTFLQVKGRCPKVCMVNEREGEKTVVVVSTRGTQEWPDVQRGFIYGICDFQLLRRPG